MIQRPRLNDRETAIGTIVIQKLRYNNRDLDRDIILQYNNRGNDSNIAIQRSRSG